MASGIHLYTDGACSGNPGRGGFGLILEWNGHVKEYSEGFRLTTNNRMELLSVITGLEMIRTPGSEITVWSDSKYVVDAVEKKWVFNWEKKGFSGKKNPDLWIRFLRIFRQHKVRFRWIRGHNEHPQNERCDALAVAAAREPHLKIDAGFEQSKSGLF
jgi:ribonuclease HI